MIKNQVVLVHVNPKLIAKDAHQVVKKMVRQKANKEGENYEYEEYHYLPSGR